MTKNKIHKDDFDGYLKFKKKNNFYKISGRQDHIKRKNSTDKKFSNLIIKHKNQKFRSCIICNTKKNKILFYKNNFKHVKCINCDFVYVNPILKEKIQLKALKKETSYNKVMANKVNVRLDILRFKYGLQKLNTTNKRKKILDYGCGFGLFIDQAKKEGWHCSGYEINEECIKILKKKNFSIDNKFKKNTYDAVTMWLVLEHIPRPNKLMKKIFLSLKKNGKLLVNVPNVESISSLILKEKCTMFSGEQHINHFSPKTLINFLEKNHFNVKFLETIISDAGTVKNYLNYKDMKSGKAVCDYYFTDPRNIHKNLMGYTILVLAQKKK